MANKIEPIASSPIAQKSRDIMRAYYKDAIEAEGSDRKIAWITSGAPVEPLQTMNIIPIYPENHSAMIAASKMGEDFCSKAEDMGYSIDLCSYARADISCAKFKGGPIGGLPRPDMLILSNNICGTVLKWFEVQARYFRVPMFIFDTPICHTEYSPEVAEYVETQVDEYIAFLEKVTGRKFDYDRLNEVGKLSYDTMDLWRKILDTTITRPSPLTAFDAFFFLSLIVTLKGTQVAVDFYTELLQVMKERARQGIGVVPNEKYRLLWDNLPVWHGLRWLSDKFASHNACLVGDTYTKIFSEKLEFLDRDNFIDTMAEAHTRIYLNTGVDQMAEKVLDMIDFYMADGFVMHSNRSCKPYSFGQMDIMEMVRKKHGIPVLMIEADMVDPRSFSQSQIETRIDAFMEIFKQRKG